MSATLLLVTEVPVRESEADSAVKNWQEVHARHQDGRALYRSIDDRTLLELRPLTGDDDIAGLQDDARELWDALSPLLAGDFRRHLYSFVEAPKGCASALPDTPYVQLRRVEVKPPVISEYRAWRDRTIFEVVREADESEVFLAYHSLLSSEPGVLFVAGFSVDPARHNGVYETPAYDAILAEVRQKYIIPQGGDAGLYLKTYARIEA
ncbi:hypothetical protein [Streptomyces odontomachi]|uniref:hypothetical protein n=1 Tax=Streptomyces odontomachi TaxID=2944940 RepID=UPI00210AF8BE|nr:hypothetical protein [Streptomyces sp. ODS25]